MFLSSITLPNWTVDKVTSKGHATTAKRRLCGSFTAVFCLYCYPFSRGIGLSSTSGQQRLHKPWNVLPFALELVNLNKDTYIKAD